ncbi:MAG: sugar phosphate isomerase/epimerase [Clostridia bacterium]|nr:sugar phosphate isomerase/epimerase [Clostridia bacterium]
MLFATQTDFLARKYGLVRAVEMLIEAGYPAIDVTMYHTNGYPFTDDYREVAARLRSMADKAGVRFVQAHAPFGGGYDRYLNELIPLFPRVFEFCSLLGIENLIVHPIMRGHYYGAEAEHFDMNMKFYRAIAPLSRTNKVKIAIENMWDRHPVTGRICDHVCADPHELVRYYDELADPEVFTVCLDIGHVALCGREPEDAVRIIGRERLGCIHAHDVDYVSDLHTLPGTSKINWDKVSRALGEIDYKGPFTLEADCFYDGFMEEHYPAVTKFMADTARVISNKIDLYRP